MPDPLPVVIHATITDHLRKAEDMRMRRRPVWAMVKQRGQIKYNCAGDKFDWRVKYKLAPSQGYRDMKSLNYAVHDKVEKAELGYRAFVTTEAISAMQKMQNKGAQAIVRLVDEIVPDMTKRLTDEISEQFFGDGDASGDDELWQGLEIMLAERATPAVTDQIAEPGDTYATLATNLGTKGGTWTSAGGAGTFPNATLANDFPYGQGEYEYDYYSPLLVNWSSTDWTGLTTFRANGLYVLRETITWQENRGGEDCRPGLILMTPRMFSDYKNSQDPRQQITVSATDSPLWKLGFRNVMNLDGVEITHDYDVPANTFYGLNFDQIQCRSMNEQLFWAPNLPMDPTRLADLFAMGAFGNFRFRNPKAFCKGKNYASS